jgi:hypothetical protein
MGDDQTAGMMELGSNEWIICPAIWIDDGLVYENQPENIITGYVVFGIHIVDIFFRMSGRNVGKPLNIKALKLNEVHEGYYTNQKRFVKKWIDY